MDAYWILGDQLQHDHPALKKAREGDLFVFIESQARGAHLRYHQHKLVLIYSAMRHYARQLQSTGHRVAYQTLEVNGSADFLSAWKEILREHPIQRIHIMEPSEWTMHAALDKISRQIGLPIERLPTNQFLVSRDAFKSWAGGRRRLLMADHYRRQRETLGILWDARKGPEGGAWSFDIENRETFASFARSPVCPPPPSRVSPDPITKEVIRMVEARFPDHPGRAGEFWLPVTRPAALEWLDDFIRQKLEHFGPYEDTMAEGQPHLFHSVLSPLINVGLLRPMECVERAVEAYQQARAPLQSVEGFIRQIVGWREFINGIYWLHMPGYAGLNALDAHRPLPVWMRKGDPPLNCLKCTVQEARSTGYNHHIQRLMVLGNFFLLGGYEPREVLEWYMEMYVDAYDWVMQPNVLGMILHADGGIFATKPYAAGPGYINRMSNYCSSCAFDPKLKSGPKACPFHFLYWNFFDRHKEYFRNNPRVGMAVRTWEKKPEAERGAIREGARAFLEG